MRHGFTTGSCAAAAAKAAAWMLFSDSEKKNISIITPKGIEFDAIIEDINRTDNFVSCAVRKDGGDDPDVTTGALVYAKVEMHNAKVEALNSGFPYENAMAKATQYMRPENMRWKATGDNASEKEKKDALIIIDGGEGVGRITRPGLDQPVGNAAINSVPRSMIEKEVREVMELFDCMDDLKVTISIPDGVELAKKTFNPNLGIEGGISVLGTSGVVEPMSVAALIATIRAEMSVRKAEGAKKIALTFGNYGRDYMKEAFGFDIDTSVKCSNFMGEAIELACEMGFEEMLITGHSGKLVKVAGGIMNTHSKEADCRMELIAAAAVYEDVPAPITKKILTCLSTEEAFMILKEAGCLEKVNCRLTDRIKYHLDRKAAGRIKLECIMYANDFGMLGSSEGAMKLLEELKHV